MNENPNRAEAERLLGIAEKLLQSRDLNGTKDFAVLAQETEPLLEGTDQILAVADVLLSAEKHVNDHHDWYSILQITRKTDDSLLIKKQYHRLALLLHPDKNKYPFADQAFNLVADAWAVLSDTGKKTLYDKELSLFSKIDLSASGKLPVRRSQRPVGNKKAETVKINVNNESNQQEGLGQKTKVSSFWTACPYCYILYEYPRVYENCCLRCQSCQRGFHAVLIPSLPPLIPGKESYYCCWGFFPLGFTPETAGSGGESGGVGSGFPNWMPPMFGTEQQQGGDKDGKNGSGGSHSRVNGAAATPVRVGVKSRDRVVGASGGRARGVVGNATGMPGPRKRGRPRKYPLPS
ncbi:CHAPERONE DNAJ-DOMAIN SUPERFAMILY PROTEIN [Salix purpurea]|uniref:CHAPERONE DNAJ-DOMAIN SUPERFAMILY PROTEIN n=1 Tax=Salix purpurea TaxID=77065 RepID=A0A9Q0PCL5_SALPP|nr:CHAPERONE DNAJ-DOMAIN SUPERFAMILY PROTEIN [Salix purpurea]